MDYRRIIILAVGLIAIIFVSIKQYKKNKKKFENLNKERIKRLKNRLDQ